MTHNSLKINRLVVHTIDGKVAYDEQFHDGVNIIRGDNSSGKSTVTHFIFYILGGAFNDWVKEAKRCSDVYAEVELNGAVVTLKRSIVINENGRANDKESMFLFWGNVNDALKNATDWYRFGFNSTDDRKSFSNVLFENLDIPIVKGDNNISMHQLLRLMYLDQDSPTNSLFLYEQFDSQLTRETVADLLLGVYNQTLYFQKQRKIDAEKELESITAEIRAIKKFIPNALDLIPANILSKIKNIEKEITEIETNITNLKENKKRVVYTEKMRLEFEKLTADAVEQRKKVVSLEGSVSTNQNEIEDNTHFITALKNKYEAIRKSIETRDFLGELPFENCPECLSELSTNVADGSCKLCRNPIDRSYGISKARKIEQELTFQIRESTSITEEKISETQNLLAQLKAERENLFHIQTKVNHALKDVKSVREEKIDTLYIAKGQNEGELTQLTNVLEKAEAYQNLVSNAKDLEEEIALLKISNESMMTEQLQLTRNISATVEKIGVYLLNNDLKRQVEFKEAKEFHIDYRNNLAFIADKESRYSASSSFYLKASARFALFLASLTIPKMRYPRFIFSDNMEDKGIEKERAQNFQKLLVAEAQKFDSKLYQLIYTTSYIPEEFNNTELCVGEYYTVDNPTLKNIAL